MLGVYSVLLLIIDLSAKHSRFGLVDGSSVIGRNSFGGIYKLPELVVQSNSSYLVKHIETRLECRIAGQPIEWANATMDRLLWLKDGMTIFDEPSSNMSSEEERQSVGEFVLERTSNSIILRIVQATHHAEGEYQCSAIVRRITVAPGQTIDSRLVSAPLKLRRARITKFERYDSAPVVRVRQGQVARLTCHGIPDVIPGPPELWFEKHGHDGLALGRTGNERFIVTASGLQIALTQPTDAGRYFCVVRNTFTNQTRRAPRPGILVVEPAILADYQKTAVEESLNRNGASFSAVFPRLPPHFPHPRIVHPESLNYSVPIEFHAVIGETVILECVIWDAKVMWNWTGGAPLPVVTLTDDRARIRQIWGNLRIKQVTVEDSGEYVCYGIPPTLFAASSLSSLLSATTNSMQFPRVTYRLIVHAPTNVRLMLAQQINDKSWQLSCYAHNLRYEIPMVYVNGLALIDAMEEMGVSPQTNFFTNPINVTLGVNNPLAGSVQCISRPAMEEAEVYGSGLERGRSMNLYVDSRLNQRDDVSLSSMSSGFMDISASGVASMTERKSDGQQHELRKLSLDRLNKMFAKELTKVTEQTRNTIGEDEMEKTEPKKEASISTALLSLSRPTAFIGGDNSVRIQWNLEPKGHPAIARIQHFAIEMFREKNNNDEASNESTDGIWTVVDHVQPHVRALTIRRLLTDSGEQKRFQLRVTATFEDRTQMSSRPTEWLRMVSYKQRTADRQLIPPSPVIIKLQTISYESMLVAWNHSSLLPPKEDILRNSVEQKVNEIRQFIVTYEPLNSDHFASPLRSSAKEVSLLRDDDDDVDDDEEELEDEDLSDSNDETKTVEVDAKSTEILLSGLKPDTDYRVTVIAENGAGRRSAPSRSRIARTYVLIDEENYSDENSTSGQPTEQVRHAWWTKLRLDYLNLPDISFKFELMFGALCVAAVLLIILCCLTASRLSEWHRQAIDRRRLRRGCHQSSTDSDNQFFIGSGVGGGLMTSGEETSTSPTFSSTSHRLYKRDKQLYHEPCFYTAKDPIGELSPLGNVGGGVYYERGAEGGGDYASRKVLNAIVKSDGGREKGVVIGSTSTSPAKATTNVFQRCRPNLYGDPSASLDEIMDDIYGTTGAHNTGTLSRKTATVGRSSVNGGGYSSGTLLRRAASFQRTNWQKEKLNGNNEGNLYSVNNGGGGDPTTTLRRCTPSPSALSTSLYGGSCSVNNNNGGAVVAPPLTLSLLRTVDGDSNSSAADRQYLLALYSDDIHTHSNCNEIGREKLFVGNEDGNNNNTTESCGGMTNGYDQQQCSNLTTPTAAGPPLSALLTSTLLPMPPCGSDAGGRVNGGGGSVGTSGVSSSSVSSSRMSLLNGGGGAGGGSSLALGDLESCYGDYHHFNNNFSYGNNNKTHPLHHIHPMDNIGMSVNHHHVYQQQPLPAMSTFKASPSPSAITLSAGGGTETGSKSSSSSSGYKSYISFANRTDNANCKSGDGHAINKMIAGI